MHLASPRESAGCRQPPTRAPLIAFPLLRRVRACARGLQYEAMGLSGSWRSARGAALLAFAVLLLGVGAFLSWSATESGGPLTGSWVVQGTNAYPPSGGQPAVLEGEAERDQSPVNAGLLTVLLLASFLGTGAGWRLAYDPRHAAPCSPGVPGAPSFEAAREDEAFLSVFRL